MKVILVIVALFALVIGASINDMAVNIFEQIYAGLFYIIAMMAFCTFALLFKGTGSWKCRWLRRECGLEVDDVKAEETEVIVAELADEEYNRRRERK